MGFNAYYNWYYLMASIYITCHRLYHMLFSTPHVIVYNTCYFLYCIYYLFHMFVPVISSYYCLFSLYFTCYRLFCLLILVINSCFQFNNYISCWFRRLLSKNVSVCIVHVVCFLHYTRWGKRLTKSVNRLKT